MEKKSSEKKIIEDTVIKNLVTQSKKKFNEKIKKELTQEFEKYLGDWEDVKPLFYDSITGGKHLRAFSTFLFYKLAGGNAENYTKIAASMELLHCTSLLVDDEIDKSKVREDRNMLTLREKYSPEEALSATLLNLLYTTHLFYESLEELDQKRRKIIKEKYLSIVTDGCNGELEKWNYTNKRIIPSRDIYFNKFLRNTAALFFQLSAEAGALFATEDKKIINKCSQIGYLLGELLQAGDDIKDLKEDMQDGFYSLTVIDYLDSLKGKEKEQLKENLSAGLTNEQIEKLYNKMLETGTINKVLDEINMKGEEIIQIVNKFPDLNEKELIINMTCYLKDRMKISK